MTLTSPWKTTPGSTFEHRCHKSFLYEICSNMPVAVEKWPILSASSSLSPVCPPLTRGPRASLGVARSPEIQRVMSIPAALPRSVSRSSSFFYSSVTLGRLLRLHPPGVGSPVRNTQGWSRVPHALF